jgi:peroxiredoxin
LKFRFAALCALISLGAHAAPAATLEGTLFDGAKFSLAAERGQVVLVSFWSTDCLPCRKSMFELQRFEAEYRDRGVKVVMVGNDSAAKLTEFARSRGLTLVQMAQASARLSGWDHQPHELPVVYTIDRDGNIANRHAGLFRLRHLEVGAAGALAAPRASASVNSPVAAPSLTR